MANTIFKGTLSVPSGIIDVTDPCYDWDIWCRETVSVRPGSYNCYYTEEGSLVLSCKILHEDIDKDEEETLHVQSLNATIGVDAGLAGFFVNKPDFPDDIWQRFCKIVFGNGSEKAWNFSEERGDLCTGFFTESGEGDGGYPVYAFYENGEIVGLSIEFD